jgi:hypothetical protein
MNSFPNLHFFTENHGGSYQQQMDYHTNFMRTQNIASSFAEKYNEAMSEAQKHFSNNSQDILRSLPRIYFIEPIVVELTHNGKEKNILIERYLEGEYKKFNSNMGYVEDEVKQLVNRMNDLGLGSNLRRPKNDGLGAIVEDSDEEEESDDDANKEMFDSKHLTPYGGQYKDLQDAYFPQAFSHFSFVKSKMKLMVVDLQGVFTQKDDGTKVYELTDPVIHQRPSGRKSKRVMLDFGRTDRGVKGMKAFFESHKCTDACKFLGLSEFKADDMK